MDMVYDQQPAEDGEEIWVKVGLALVDGSLSDPPDPDL